MKTGESGMVNTEGDSRFRLPHRNLLKVAWQGVMVALTLIGVVTAVTENASTEGVSWPARILFAAFSAALAVVYGIGVVCDWQDWRSRERGPAVEQIRPE